MTSNYQDLTVSKQINWRKVYLETGMRKITFQTDKNQNSFIFSVDHNDIFDHKYCIDQGNLLRI